VPIRVDSCSSSRSIDESPIKPATRVTLTLLSVLLLTGGTICIIFSWHHLQGSDDAELTGWAVVLGLGLSAAAAFLAESALFPEPVHPSAPLRFVILHHQGINDPHFDIMLETAPASLLASWRSPLWPITQPTTLLQLPDHRRDYLEYEGEISGNRGHVTRIATGTYRVTHRSDDSKLIEWDAPAVPSLLLTKLADNRWSAQSG
jgi:hypothetical protein